MYAVIETGGKQYKVQEGDVLFVEKLSLEDGQSVVFDKVLMLANGKKVTAGAPFVKGVTVEATVLKTGKGKKIKIFKYKAKKGYRKRQGHRQPYTKVQIQSIAAGDK